MDMHDIVYPRVIASEAKQSRFRTIHAQARLLRFARNDKRNKEMARNPG